MPRTRLYRHGVLEAEGFDLREAADLRREDGALVWIDLLAPDPALLNRVGEELGWHVLAVEDAVEPHERPKLHEYDTHRLLTAYAVRLGDDGALTTAGITAFATPDALVTVRPDDDFDIGAVVERWDATTHLAASGVGYLLHGLLDYAVDTHFDAVQALDGRIEGLEDLVFADQDQPGRGKRGSDTDLQRQALALRKSLVALRRVVLPMREVVNALVRRDHDLVDARMTPYYQDVYDHVLRAAEWTDSLRDLVATVRETQLSIQANRLNLVMKKVTGWAAVIAVPTAITGYFGQNIPFPGFEQPWGFWTSTAALTLGGLGLYSLFKREDWL
ncbi:magnesium transporter CorA family protein [Actinosynnema mirum]|uniref:Mg2 transporter protein CorA family protein n=1 Tax=Actinosynnema mirum (strain ATCC 29888 / DSM 43827 / JCM 3225 / NBRC 14064 / NCIMB 13271 / NRRL B-12336 / IMRU 3971 / 101) TaxID=446462 RepID=C6WCY2_ACTMD|nr:magnesium transporter CorA family protein [Actinosynnema mirum]ACU37601.1 Mg2 transporter protein CorA family protein [Actinosynnema mirum DSM 43827]